MLEEFAAQPLEDGDQVAPIPASAKSARPAMPKPEATADALDEVEVEPSTVMDEVQRRRPLIEQLVRDGRRLRAAGLYGADVLIRHAREADIDLPRELVRDIADAIADPYGIPNEPLAGVKPDGGEDGDE